MAFRAAPGGPQVRNEPLRCNDATTEDTSAAKPVQDFQSCCAHSTRSVTEENHGMHQGSRVAFAKWLHNTEHIGFLRLAEQKLESKLLRARQWRFHSRRSLIFKQQFVDKEQWTPQSLCDDDFDILPRRNATQLGSFRFLTGTREAQKGLRALAHRRHVSRILLEKRYLTYRVRLPVCTSWLPSILPSSPESVFITHIRMNRSSFGRTVSILTNTCGHIFANGSRRKQLPISIQLYIAIHGLGFYGNGENLEQTRTKFGYSIETIFACRRRVYTILCDLQTNFIVWPSAGERKQLCEHVRVRHGYKSCFFIVDGTTHPFAFVPGYQRNSSYDRKKKYSMQAPVTCDSHLQEIYLVVGWPGSTHDARVLRSADYMDPLNEREYFTRDERGLGDVAFGLRKRAIPNYKEPLANCPENRRYNYLHASLRVRSEHCIEHVKGLFQGLKEVRLNMHRQGDCRWVVEYITAVFVLYNKLPGFDDRWNRLHFEANCHDTVQSLSSDEGNGEDSFGEYGDCTAFDFREKVKRQVLHYNGYEL